MDLTQATKDEIVAEVARRMTASPVDASKGGLMPTSPLVNQVPVLAPPQPTAVNWLRYHFAPSDAINLKDNSQTDPRFLSTRADAEAISKEAGGSAPYLSPGLTTIGPSGRQVWLVDFEGMPPGSVCASQLIANKFDYYILDVTGNMLPPKGRWVKSTYVFDDPRIDAWSHNPPV